MEPLFKATDTVKLKEEYVEKVMNHQKVFEMYHQIGTPRDWIVSLCSGTPMRILDVEVDLNKQVVLTLRTDPRHVVWQQEWFELVSHENFNEDVEEDMFTIE